MRIGEIVKLPDGRIGRLTEIKGSSYIVAGIMRSKTELTAIANVADVFEYAGFPVPSGAVVRLDLASHWYCLQVSDGRLNAHEFKGAWIEGHKRPLKAVDTFNVSDPPDLSRLPASDAWDALPEAVKRAVTGEGSGEAETQEDMLVLIRGRVRAAGSQKGAARLLGVSPQYLNDVLLRRREVSANLAAQLGYDRIVSFRPKGASDA